MISSTTFQGYEVLALQDGESRALIAPAQGARLLTWDVGERSVIRWPQQADWKRIADVRGGNPILFPFVARHMVNGEIGLWKDEAGTVRRLPMHGFARDMAFEVVLSGDTRLHMRLRSSEATRAMYPFDFQFDVVYQLNGSTLEARLETTNTGEQTLPYYAGHHFYFAVPHEERAQWRLTLPCAQWAEQNFHSGDIRFKPAGAAETTLDDPALVDRLNVHPGDAVTLANATDGRRLAIDLKSTPPWHTVTTWTESEEADFYCIEPWLGLPNAIHHGHGLRHLAPGQCERAVCSIDAAAW